LLKTAAHTRLKNEAPLRRESGFKDPGARRRFLR
jgi:hypothetical protein